MLLGTVNARLPELCHHIVLEDELAAAKRRKRPLTDGQVVALVRRCDHGQVSLEEKVHWMNYLVERATLTTPESALLVLLFEHVEHVPSKVLRPLIAV